MSFANMYIAASAGAGKTYQLVGRFITLLCIQELRDGQLAVGKLIAITFTRKAASEFKSRILADLAAAASDEISANQFWQERVAPTLTQLELALPQPQPTQDFFARLLRGTMSQFSQLQLSTIDSLFGRMAQGLSGELGVAHISPIDPIEEKLYRRDALDAIYRSTRSAQELDLLHEYFLDSQANDSALSSPDQSLYKLITDSHELYLNAPDAQWGGLPDDMSEAQLALFGLSPQDVKLEMSEEQFDQMAEALKQLITQEPELFEEPQGSKGIYQIGNEPQLINMHASAKRWYRSRFFKFAQSLCLKNGALELPTLPETAESPLLYLASERYPQYWALCERRGIKLHLMARTRTQLIWRKQLQRTHAIARLIGQYENIYGQEIREHGKMGFSDIARLLQDQEACQDLALIQERLDLQLEHWMLDEFQDTSYEQYSILHELLAARAQEGDEGSVFMVGDAKQSIYQFRGGDPEIFLRARSELFGLSSAGQTASKELPLNKSYRSSQTVLELANELFGKNLADYAQKLLPGTLKQWESFGFSPHESAQTKLSGCTEIWQIQISEADELSAQEKLFHSIAAQLQSVRPKGEPQPASCAILVSTRAEGRQIQEALIALQANYHFEGPIALCDEKEIAQDSVLGVALMQFFRWLATPGDEHSLSLLRLSPLWERIEEWGGRSAWVQLRSIWSNQGICPLLRELFSTESTAPLLNKPYLRKSYQIWWEQAARFDERGGELSEWVEHMSNLRAQEEAQGQEIRIMTIHKSKGLEFDWVILPIFARATPFFNYHKLNLLRRRDEQGKAIAMICPPPYAQVEEHPHFHSHMVAPQQEREELAGLCKLYVALTRAKRATSIILPPESKTESTSSKESLQSILQELAYAGEGGGAELYPMTQPDEQPLALCLRREGKPLWHREKTNSPAADTTPPCEPIAPELNYQFFSLRRRSPSSMNEATKPAAAKRKPTKKATNRAAQIGTLIHQELEKIEWLAAPRPFNLLADSTSEQIERALQSPDWQALLTRPAHPVQLYREQSIQAIIQNEWISGQIDRLQIHYENGLNAPATRAQLIDYKSDASEGKQLKAHYREQMRLYRQMIALAFGLELGQVQVTLLHCPAKGEAKAWHYEESDW